MSDFFETLAVVHNNLHAAYEVVPQDETEINDVGAMLTQIVEQLNKQRDEILVERPLTMHGSAILSAINSTITRLSARLARLNDGLRTLETFEAQTIQ
jgi:hypothetical protein